MSKPPTRGVCRLVSEGVLTRDTHGQCHDRRGVHRRSLLDRYAQHAGPGAPKEFMAMLARHVVQKKTNARKQSNLSKFFKNKKK